MRISALRWLFHRGKQQPITSKPMEAIVRADRAYQLIADDIERWPVMCEPDMGLRYDVTGVIDQGPTLADPPIYERETAVVRI